MTSTKYDMDKYHTHVKVTGYNFWTIPQLQWQFNKKKEKTKKQKKPSTELDNGLDFLPNMI